jgi:hypothetical protein
MPCDEACKENIQKIIYKQVRVSGSQYTDVKKSVVIGGARLKLTTNSKSDRATTVPGVDVKHNSYARYLGKLKAKELIPVRISQNPLVGNKTQNYRLGGSILYNNCC